MSQISAKRDPRDVKGLVPAGLGAEHQLMAINREHSGAHGDDDDTEAVEQVVEDVRDDIRHGQVADDVSHVLEERLHEAGVELRPEVIDDLAEDIENDVSI
jgi:hypothetical protein